MSYILPTSSTQPPGGLTLTQFIQTVIAGISGLDGTLVRPKWQLESPKQPDYNVTWIAFGTDLITPDTYGYLSSDAAGVVSTQRHETLEVAVSIYGTLAYNAYGFLRDGLQIPDNLAALESAGMAFTEITPARRIPDLVNERWINRLETTINLRRMVQSVYPISTFISASGTIHSDAEGVDYVQSWTAGP